jgi:hypothetical protein
VAAALEAGCRRRVHHSSRRAEEPSRQRVTAAARVFNDRILRQAVAANLWSSTCGSCNGERRLRERDPAVARRCAQEVANVGRSALYEVSGEPGRTRVYF